MVFGVTGDLARKKLIPAVYDLANRGLLPPGFVLLGFARRDWGDGDFESLARTAAQKGARTEFRERRGRGWPRRSSSCPAASTTTHAFDTLAQTLRELDGTHGTQGNAAFYLSIPPAAFPTVLKQMQRTGMADNRESGGWRRVVVEKPFGNDLPSSKELNDLVDDVFTARDVFRIDHYLGKETVQNLLALRFANTLFEPIWNGHHVDSVQITMAEDVGIGGRAGFYEGIGAARDVLQNHLLQLLALTAMEEPVELRRREPAHREAQGAGRDHACPTTCAPVRRPRPVRPGLAGRRAGHGLPRRGGRRRREPHRDLRRRPPRRRDPPLGRRAVLPARRQAAAPTGDRDRRRLPAARRTCRSPRATPRSSAPTSWSCASSPTRA